ALNEGEKKLADLLTENSIHNIPKKQEAIAELAKKTTFRQEFSALAQLSVSSDKPEKERVKKTLHDLKTHRFFTPQFAKVLSLVFSLLSILVIAAYFGAFISGKQLTIYVLIGLAISGIYIKRVNCLSETVSQMQSVFRQYRHLLGLIENTNFSAVLLKGMQERISTPNKKASAILNEFSKAIDAQ